MQPFHNREIDARARAKRLGVFVTVKLARHYYQSPSQSHPGEFYDLVLTSGGWACTCKGWQFTGLCKHIGALERRAEREDWSFGFRVAQPVRPAAQPSIETIDWETGVISESIADRRARVNPDERIRVESRVAAWEEDTFVA